MVSMQHLADALAASAVRQGETTPAVRGADWQMATVTAVRADGTVDCGQIRARRLESYDTPMVGDLIAVIRSGPGNWLALGRTLTGRHGIGDIAFTYKPSDTARANTATAAADPHLTVTLDPSSIYTMEAQIMYAANTTGDFLVGWTAPPGASGSWTGIGPGRSATSSVNGNMARMEAMGLTTALTFGGVGGNSGMQARGLIHSGSGGAYTVVWAQAAADPGATTLLANSWFTVQKVAVG